MKKFVLLGASALLAASFIACGDDGSSAAPVEEPSSAGTTPAPISSESGGTEGSSSSSLLTSSSWSGAIGSSSADTSREISSSSLTGTSSSLTGEPGDTTRITYALRRFDGPLTNPHKGFTVPTEAAWTFDPGFEYGPHGSLNNGAWDLVTYGSGYQQWNKLNPAKGVYDWSELEELLDALAAHNMGYALRVFPYSPSFIRDDSTPEENYDWTPKYVYEAGAKKITARYKENNANAAVPVWDDSVYLYYAKEFATALAAKYDGDPRIEYIDVRSLANGASGTCRTWTGAACLRLKSRKTC